MGRTPPKDLESVIEQRQILLAMRQQTAGGVAEILLAADGDGFRGPHQIQHIAGAEIHPQPPQSFPEQQQIGQDVALPSIIINHCHSSPPAGN